GAERGRSIGTGTVPAPATKNRPRIGRGVARSRQWDRAAIRARVHRWAPPPRLVPRALISRPRPLALEIRKFVDVVHDTGVIDLKDLHPFGMLPQELARAVVAAQGRELFVEAQRESDRMSTLTAERRRGDRCAFLQGFRDDPDGFGTDERHVGARDHPTFRVGVRVYPCGK